MIAEGLCLRPEISLHCGRKLLEGQRGERTVDVGTNLEVQKSSNRVFSKFFFVIRNIDSAFAIR